VQLGRSACKRTRATIVSIDLVPIVLDISSTNKIRRRVDIKLETRGMKLATSFRDKRRLFLGFFVKESCSGHIRSSQRDPELKVTWRVSIATRSGIFTSGPVCSQRHSSIPNSEDAFYLAALRLPAQWKGFSGAKSRGNCCERDATPLASSRNERNRRRLSGRLPFDTTRQFHLRASRLIGYFTICQSDPLILNRFRCVSSCEC